MDFSHVDADKTHVFSFCRQKSIMRLTTNWPIACLSFTPMPRPCWKR